jgi:hypothetical protein
MGQEIDLMDRFPQPKRNLGECGATKPMFGSFLEKKWSHAWQVQTAPVAWLERRSFL